ncbi:c-type cytochrome biogenesis protein CcsB [Clostridium formicaceticum]|uniref:C-type cytochrome biogenesis protein CcsB n=1 Tax=Clostridium formicaceticum TaxID=1497 RepID=A0AAC9WGN1_9CLOT|nr:c-type cytochrome biogenesis protein CcsB [Clostridium formicaceticum]AOY77449.1 c-type cytochrome biogenesis protein CcsB [Clostridium formicaceticum]ARE88006.1 Cytochrome c biogenesis protein CcsA [Clostridium formicaceticum]
MLNEDYSFIATLIFYGLSVLAYFVFFMFRNEKFSNYGSLLVKLGVIFHTVALASRSVEASRLPLSNQYEFATTFAWGIAVSFVGFEWKYKFKALGTFVTPLIVLVAFYAALQSKEIRPLMPALQSNWITIHVSTAIFSYGAFAIGCGVSMMYLIRDRLKEDPFITKYMPTSEILDSISYRAIALGFIMLTVVIISGAIWAEKAWGRYWQWDPKETWSFITWIIYAIYLHVRLSKGWKNKKAAWFAILGFLAILFTYIGVNTVLSGYHSYA